MSSDSSEFVVLDVDVAELDRLAAVYSRGDRNAFLHEAVRVMASLEPPETRQVTTATPHGAAPPSPETSPTAVAAPAPAETPAAFIAENAKTSVNMDLLTRLKLRADTAVLRTAGLPGGYRSRGQLINAAIEAELVRLEAQFNNGEEFPPNVGSFRTGRPLGS